MIAVVLIVIVLIVTVLIVNVLIVTVLAVVAQAVVVPTARPATVAEPGLDQGKPFERTLQMEFQPVAQQLSPSCIVYISMSPFLRKKNCVTKRKVFFYSIILNRIGVLLEKEVTVTMMTERITTIICIEKV